MKKKFLLPILFLLPLLCGGFNKSNNTSNNEFLHANRQYLVQKSHESDDFISYWENDFREHNPEVCEIPYEAYHEMYERYIALSKEDREVVNSTIDTREPDYTIGAIIKTLVNKFYPNTNSTKQEKQKLDQSTVIIIATVVALVGASAISVLYILKNNKVIK